MTMQFFLTKWTPHWISLLGSGFKNIVVFRAFGHRPGTKMKIFPSIIGVLFTLGILFTLKGEFSKKIVKERW